MTRKLPPGWPSPTQSQPTAPSSFPEGPSNLRATVTARQSSRTSGQSFAIAGTLTSTTQGSSYLLTGTLIPTTSSSTPATDLPQRRRMVDPQEGARMMTWSEDEKEDEAIEDDENEDETTGADTEYTKNTEDTEEREESEEEADVPLAISGRRGLGALSLLTSNISSPPTRKRSRRQSSSSAESTKFKFKKRAKLSNGEASMSSTPAQARGGMTSSTALRGMGRNSTAGRRRGRSTFSTTTFSSNAGPSSAAQPDVNPQTSSQDWLTRARFTMNIAGRRQTHIAHHDQTTRSEALTFVREPNNSFDSNAIAVRNTSGVLVGYVERTEAARLASRLDRDIIRLEGTTVGSRGLWGINERRIEIVILSQDPQLNVENLMPERYPHRRSGEDLDEDRQTTSPDEDD